MDDVQLANREHHAVACAAEGASIELEAQQIASGLGLPGGTWLVKERGLSRDTAYVLLINAESHPMSVVGFSFTQAEVAGQSLTCLLPRSS
jgi:hypothetical protein